MSRATRMDKAIRALLPLESYRSPWVPTRRLGQDALVAVADPFRQGGDASVAPTTWFAVTPDFSTLLAFARTSVVTPVVGFQSEAIENRPPALRAQEAHAAWWAMSEAVWPEFFAQRRSPADAAKEVSAAFDSTVPGRLQPWIRACCADFFEWLDASPFHLPEVDDEDVLMCDAWPSFTTSVRKNLDADDDRDIWL